MPNLEAQFASDHWTADEFHDEIGEATWEIVDVDQREVYNRQANRKEQAWALWFRENDRCIYLRRPLYLQIKSLYGPDTDHWKGRLVTLHTVPLKSGQSAHAIRVRPQRYPAADAVIEAPMVARFLEKLRQHRRTAKDFAQYLRSVGASDLAMTAEKDEPKTWTVRLWTHMKGYVRQIEAFGEGGH